MAGIGIASRRGTREFNADGAHVYEAPDGTVIAAVVDGTGNSAELDQLADAMALVVARVGYRRGGLAALITAADLIHDRYDAAAVSVEIDPDGEVHTYWIGDCRASWWTGTELRQLTTDHTMGELLRRSGGPAAQQIAAGQDHWLRLGITGATPATVAEVCGLDVNGSLLAPSELILLTSDGVHDQLSESDLLALLRSFSGDTQRLAESIVEAVPSSHGYRDDATAVVLTFNGSAREQAQEGPR